MNESTKGGCVIIWAFQEGDKFLYEFFFSLLECYIIVHYCKKEKILTNATGILDVECKEHFHFPFVILDE